MLTYTEINTLVSFLEENKDAQINLKSLINDKYTKEHIDKNLLDLDTFKRSISNIYDNIFNTCSIQYNFIWCGNHYALDVRYAEIQERYDINKIYNVVICNNFIIVIPMCSNINKIIDKIRDATSGCVSQYCNSSAFILEIENLYNTTIPPRFNGISRLPFLHLLNTAKLGVYTDNYCLSYDDIKSACKILWGIESVGLKCGSSENEAEVYYKTEKICDVHTLGRLLYIYNQIKSFSKSISNENDYIRSVAFNFYADLFYVRKMDIK